MCHPAQRDAEIRGIRHRATARRVGERDSSAWTREAQLPRAERLGDVVVGAGVEAGLDVGLLGPRGQQDDREVGERRVGPDRADRVEPGDARHHHVEDRQVGPLGLAGVDRGRAVGDGDDVVSERRRA